jgi:GTP-binding protein
MLNLNNARFETSAVKPEQYPVEDIPEAAFVGRSNVGKSSLINTLLNRKNLARTGAVPGRTRVINFYYIDGCIRFADLPGYGYASVSKTEQMDWGKMADTYLNTRKQLKLLLMVVDIRHLPSELDKLMYEWIKESGLPHIIAASKADKLSRSQIGRKLKDIGSALEVNEGIELIPFSSVSRAGREELWKAIERGVAACFL